MAPRTLAELEHALSSLWPNATARFYDRMELGSAPWSSRRLVRATCARDQPAIARNPVTGGLLPQDLTYQVAIPMPQDGGAIVIESYAGGEEPDNTSVAAAA